MSPLGAVTTTRGFRRPVANLSILNPAFTLGMTPSGCAAHFGPLSTWGVSKGGGKSLAVSLRRTPGASVDQSPNASLPVSSLLVSGVACGVGEVAAFVFDCCPQA